MAKQTIMGLVKTRVFYAPGNRTFTEAPIAKKKYLDASDIGNAPWTLDVTANGDLLPVGSGTTHTAATLIDAINAISSNQTTETQINITVSYNDIYDGSFFIIIDWVAGTVSWTGNQTADQGRYNGSATVPGNTLIERTSFNPSNPAATKDDQGGPWVPISLMLGTTGERKISRLPMPGMGRPMRFALAAFAFGGWDGFVNVDYVIRTTQNITVVPECPPCEECPPEVVCAPATDCPDPIVCEPCDPAEPCAPCPDPAVALGIKISELPEAPSLQDDDLFVLSQDKPDDGIYNISHRVTLANLKASIAGLFAPAITDSDVMSVLAQRDAAFSGTVSLTPPTGKKFAILSCQLDCDAVADAGGNWFLVIGKNLDTDLPTATYPAGSALPVAAQLAEIYKYSVAETSTVPGTDPNATDTNLRYVYVGDGGTVSIPWRVLIMVGPSGAVAVTITVVGWV
jgi:hypothetical protein